VEQGPNSTAGGGGLVEFFQHKIIDLGLCGSSSPFARECPLHGWMGKAWCVGAESLVQPAEVRARDPAGNSARWKCHSTLNPTALKQMQISIFETADSCPMVSNNPARLAKVARLTAADRCLGRNKLRQAGFLTNSALSAARAMTGGRLLPVRA